MRDFCRSVPYVTQGSNIPNKMQCAAAVWHSKGHYDIYDLFHGVCENNSTRRRAVRNLKRSHKKLKFHKRIISTLSTSSFEISLTVSPKPIIVLPCCLRSSVYEHLLSILWSTQQKPFIFLYDRQLFSPPWSTSSLTRIREEPQFPNPGISGDFYLRP